MYILCLSALGNGHVSHVTSMIFITENFAQNLGLLCVRFFYSSQSLTHV